jgi:predicted Zn-dependent protease
MEKILIQFAAIVVSFFGVWFLLSQIDFVNESDLQKLKGETEQKLAELIIETIERSNDKIENEKVLSVLDSIKVRLCAGKNIDCTKIKIHLIRNSEINAFALPDHNMVIYSGLLEYAENAEEVAGVMAHEIGHIEKNHVMKKLVKEIGMQMLFTIAAGDAGNDISRETAKVITSTAFDRSKEREADKFAVELLTSAHVDTQPLSNLFFRLALKDKMPEELVWISTHPDTKERAAEIIKLSKESTFEPRPVIQTSWKAVQEQLRDDDTRNNISEEVMEDSTEVQ